MHDETVKFTVGYYVQLAGRIILNVFEMQKKF